MTTPFQKRLPAKRVDAAMIGVIFLSFLIFFAWLIFQRRLLLAGDCFSYSYPLRSLAWSSIRNGELPTWTTEVLSGYPLLSMIQLGLGYPVTWFYLLLPGYIAEQLYVFAPFVLAPSFTYAYARSLDRSPLASLLAALSFAYGGAMTGLLGVIGLVGNSFLWLPLILIAIDRSRTKKFPPCLLGATAAFAMSVLNGYAQAVVFVLFISLAYALWISLFTPGPESPTLLDRLRPLGLVLCSTLLATGIAAFQILETWQAAQLSIRKSLTFITFADGSFSPTVLLRSLIVPLYMDRFADVTAFVSPIVLGLALFAVISAWRTPRSDKTVRINFWAVITIVSGFLILGSHTPLARIAFYLPLLNKFRVPSRHVYEWTFGLSILAAFGWDAIKLRSRFLESRSRLHIVSFALVLLTIITGWWWLRATTDAQTVAGVEAIGNWYAGLSVTSYLIWKFVWLVLSLTCIAAVLHVRRTRFQTAVLIILIVVSCLTEPYICFRNWWSNLAKTPQRVQTPAPVTRALAKDRDRVYTRFDLFIDDTAANPRVDSQNVPALYGLHNVAGSEPLMLDRYSRALGNVGPDSVNPIPGYPPPDFIFNDNSNVLDILNTGTVATFGDLRSTPGSLPVFEGVKLALNETGLNLPPASTKLISLNNNFVADEVVLVTSMANSVDVEQGASVARLRLSTDSNVIEKELRAGIDTAEWAHERPDVHAIIKHQQARVFDRQVGDVRNTYQACRYITRIKLENAQRITRVELVNLTPRATIALWAASLLDGSSRESQTLSRLMLTVRSNPERWQIEKAGNDVLLLSNRRVLPRAWLVSNAEAVSGEEALQRIHGESTQPFDPRTTALLEVGSQDLPALPGGTLSDGKVSITDHRGSRLRIETSASTATVLVVSEIFYPGWKATIDGQPASIMATDYLLRGVALPAGNHVVEMRYTAPQARNGAIISIISLLICGLVATRVLLTRRRNLQPQKDY